MKLSQYLKVQGPHLRIGDWLCVTLSNIAMQQIVLATKNMSVSSKNF